MEGTSRKMVVCCIVNCSSLSFLSCMMDIVSYQYDQHGPKNIQVLFDIKNGEIFAIFNIVVHRCPQKVTVTFLSLGPGIIFLTNVM